LRVACTHMTYQSREFVQTNRTLAETLNRAVYSHRAAFCLREKELNQRRTVRFDVIALL
jgi:hypothetical protein